MVMFHHLVVDGLGDAVLGDVHPGRTERHDAEPGGQQPGETFVVGQAVQVETGSIKAGEGDAGGLQPPSGDSEPWPHPPARARGSLVHARAFFGLAVLKTKESTIGPLCASPCALRRLEPGAPWPKPPLRPARTTFILRSLPIWASRLRPVDTVDLGILEASASKIRPREVGSSKVRAIQGRTRQVRTREIRTRK